jgi:hypothetical protein
MNSNKIKLAIASVAALLAIVVIVRAGRHPVESPTAPGPSEDREVSRATRGNAAPQRAHGPGSERAAVAPEPAVVQPRTAADVSHPQPGVPLPPEPAAHVPAGSHAAEASREAPPEDIASLGHMALTDADPERRVEAINLLSGTEDPEAIPFLRQALADPDAGVRLAIVKSLAEVDFTGNAAAELLSTVITADTASENRLEALKTLANIDSDQAAVLAKQALNDSDQEVRAEAKRILEPDEQM